MLATAVLMPSGTALHKRSDGITALITFEGDSDLVLVGDGSGFYNVSVSIFQKGTGGWDQIALGATLRVFEDVAPLSAVDRVSIGFTSSATEPVTISIPASAVGDGSLDIFVTFSQLGGDPTPTSHHHVAKNVAIQNGQYNLADQFDHHNTRVYAL